MQHDIEYIRSILQNSEEWITVKGNHIKLKDGETAKEATQRFIEEKQNKPKGSKITGYKEYDPENAVNITGDELGKYENDKQYIEQFKKYYKENLQGKSVESPLLGKVCFYGSGLSETIHQNLSFIKHLKYIASIPEIISRSKEIIEEKVKHPKNKLNVKKVYRVTGYVTVRDDIKKISIVILEDNRGNRFYTFDARLNKEVFKATSESAGALRKTSIDNTIIHDTNSVNSFELNLYVTETDFRLFEINF